MVMAIFESYVFIGIIISAVLMFYSLSTKPRKLLPLIIGIFVLFTIGTVVLNYGIIRIETGATVVKDVALNTWTITETQTIIQAQDDILLFWIGNMGFYGGFLGIIYLIFQFIEGQRESKKITGF